MCVGDKWNHADNIKETNVDSTLHTFTKVSLQKYQGKYRGL